STWIHCSVCAVTAHVSPSRMPCPATPRISEGIHCLEVFCADPEPAGPTWPAAGTKQDRRSGVAELPPEARRVHARVHDHAQEAELGAAQGGACPAHQRGGSHLLHPG